jgi:hypothetical protein
VSHNEGLGATARPVAASALPLGAQLLVCAAVLAALGVMVAGVIPVGLWTWIVAVALVASILSTDWGSNEGGTNELRRVCSLLSRSRSAFRSSTTSSADISQIGGRSNCCRSLCSWLPQRSRSLSRSSSPTCDACSLDNTGLLGPFGGLALLFASLTSIFAAITVIAAKEKLVRFTGGSPGSPSFEESARLYVWHFSNAVPLLDVNETLRWKAPLVYTSSRAGILVLLYKMAVIIPLIGAFFFYWKEQND